MIQTKLRTGIVLLLTILLVPSISGQDLGGDMSLNKLLIDGEKWRLVAKDLGFCDGPCADADGNFYFSDMRKGPGIFRISSDGTTTLLFKEAASGLKFGPDGRLYACQGKEKRIAAFDLKTKQMEVIATDVQPNDLVVSHRGHIYFTETRKKQVTFVDLKTKTAKAADVGITAPNGIALSADGGTLAVSDFRGRHVWVFRVESDGSLKFKEPYMTMRTEVDVIAKSPDGRSPVYQESCRGDGMTSDVQGRWYVATELGVQFFDPQGRISGVIPNPGTKGMTSVGLAGPNRDYMFVTCGDQIFRRKVIAKGSLYFHSTGR